MKNNDILSSPCITERNALKFNNVSLDSINEWGKNEEFTNIENELSRKHPGGNIKGM